MTTHGWMPYTWTSLLFCLLLAPTPTFAKLPDSLVDYLKSQKKSSSFRARKQLFRKYVGAKRYRGSRSQNIRLLQNMLKRDRKATTTLYKARKNVQKNLQARARKKGGGLRYLHKTYSVFRYVVAEGFGVHGSYSLGVSLSYRDLGKRVRVEGISISVASGSSHLGTLQLTGRFTILLGSRKVASGILGPLKTLSWKAPNTVIREARPASTVSKTGQITVKVTAVPTVKTGSGVVPLWPTTRTLTLK